MRAAVSRSRANQSETKSVGDAAFTNPLTNESEVKVTYAFDNENVGMAYEKDHVTIRGAGTATITASFAGDTNRESAKASYKLAVAKATVSLSFAKSSVSKAYGDAAFTNKLTNASKVKVTYKSSDTKVATVSSAGKVTLKGKGSATITASFAGDANHESAKASYELTVTEAAAPAATCDAHLRSTGDTKAVTVAGGKVATVGTTGQSRRLEALSLKLGESPYKGGVRYMVHMRSKGWSQGWRADGALAGTKGQSRRAEAVRVELTGELAKHYDVWYRVHAQTYGWMGWAKNGAGAGTTGQSRRMVAYQIVILPKGSAAPGTTSNVFEGKL